MQGHAMFGHSRGPAGVELASGARLRVSLPPDSNPRIGSIRRRTTVRANTNIGANILWKKATTDYTLQTWS